METAGKQPFPQSLWERYTLTNHASGMNDSEILTDSDSDSDSHTFYR